MAQPPLAFNGSVDASTYTRAFAEIEMFAREKPRWTLAPAAASYVVVHAPAVAVRERPTTESPVVRFFRPGDAVAAFGVLGVWIKLRDERGWMLLKSETYGVLARPG